MLSEPLQAVNSLTHTLPLHTIAKSSDERTERHMKTDNTPYHLTSLPSWMDDLPDTTLIKVSDIRRHLECKNDTVHNMVTSGRLPPPDENLQTLTYKNRSHINRSHAKTHPKTIYWRLGTLRKFIRANETVEFN